MDVPPPWYTLTNEACAGARRECSHSDEACQRAAASQGYRYFGHSHATMCRQQDLRAVPGPMVFVLLVSVLALIAYRLWSTRRARRREAR